MRQALLLAICLMTLQVSAAELNFNQFPTGLDAIYGRDDREFITNKSDPKVQELAKSVAMIVSVDRLDMGMFKTTIQAPSLQEALNMCVSEHFVTRPAVPACTGFLVAPNVLATAGHCFETEDDCANKKIIFDVDTKKQSKKGYSVSTNDVYACSKILSHEYSSDSADQKDYALIELDRPTKKRASLKLNLTKKIEDDSNLFMIGHPFGMPQTLSRNANVSNNNGEFQFLANLDSFEGNSGAPVFNAKTFEVEGILVNGQQDLVQDTKFECYRNVIYSGSGNEGVFRASLLPPF